MVRSTDHENTVPDATMEPVTTVVRITAIGSLAPDSISSVARTRSLRCTPLPRRIANTAAASVEETIAPSSIASGQLKPSAYAPRASITAVPMTPNVASTLAGAATARTDRSGVLKPPSNRMRTSATVPSRYDSA